MARPEDSTITVPIGRPLAGVLDICYAAGLTPLLAGGTGVGKSTQLEDYAAAKGWEFRSRDLSLMEPTDLVGLPKLDGKVTRYLPPSFLPADDAEDGLLVLEEVNRAPAYMRAPCLQLLTARTLNDYRLPANWKLAAAINPAEDGYDAADLDPALESRFVRINVVACNQEWAVWAREHKVDHRVIEYILSDARVFDSPASNPRSWTAVAKLLNASETLGTERILLRAAVAGCVGITRATSFLQFVAKPVTPFTAETLLNGYPKIRSKLTAWVREGKLELVQGSMLNLKKFLQSRTAYNAARKNSAMWQNLGQLLTDLPGDLREDAVAFFREHEYDDPALRRRKQ